jgi:hypothetical protein
VKIFASYTSDKGPISKIYTELKKKNPQPQRTNNSIKKWAHFFIEQGIFKGRGANNLYIHIHIYTHTHTHTHNGALLSHKEE